MSEIKSKICIKCGSKIFLIEEEFHRPEKSMWSGGIVDKIAAGYGSILDGNMYIIAICDTCIKKNKDILEFVGSYFDSN